MSTETNTEIDTGRTEEEKLRALVRKDVDPVVTQLAEAALRRDQEVSDS